MNPPSPAALLRQAGLKVTVGRTLVLGTLARRSTPQSIEDLARAVRAKVNLVTLYRMVQDFQMAGLVRRVDLQHGHAHYELRSAPDHHHIVCVSCGRMEDLAGCELPTLTVKILKHSRQFASVSDHSLEFYGLCKKCAP